MRSPPDARPSVAAEQSVGTIDYIPPLCYAQFARWRAERKRRFEETVRVFNFANFKIVAMPKNNMLLLRRVR